MQKLSIKSFKSLVAVLAASAVIFSCSPEEIVMAPEGMETTSSQEIPGQYIVVFNTDNTGKASSRFPGNYDQAKTFVRNNTEALLRENGVGQPEAIGYVYAMTINGFSMTLNEEDLQKIRTDKRVAYIEKDRIITMAPPWERGGGGSEGQETPYGITRVNGGVTYTGSNVAWILDTGIDLDHEDLNVDASRGYNTFTKGRDGKSLDDGNGHGTHVAGTIAAVDNNVGVIGVAAGATVVPVKVLDSRGSGSYSGVIAGVDYVGANGKNGDVANLSLGGPASQALDDAVKAASSNVKFVLAAGNDGADANSYSPARANGPNIFTISAMDANDIFASFSNWANPPVDYCAPGVSIQSTYKDGGYRSLSGTSMAAPHAAGVLLLGNAGTSGFVQNDPDGNADPIITNLKSES